MTREKILEILFEKVVVAALASLIFAIFFTVSSIQHDKRTFVSEYTSVQVKHKLEIFGQYDVAISTVLGLLRNSMVSPEKLKDVSSIKLIFDARNFGWRLDAMVPDNSDIGNSIAISLGILSQNLNEANLSDIELHEIGELHDKLESSHGKTLSNVGDWIGGVSSRSFDSASDSANEYITPFKIIAKVEVVFSLLFTIFLCIIIWRFYKNAKGQD